MSSSTNDRPQAVMYFIGVTTGKSSIMKVFPLWAAELGRPEVVLEGVDLPLHAAPEFYRQVVARIKSEDRSLGALVTSHKINLLDAARDLFDYLDPYAQICGEVSSISKAGALLAGHAKDPITSGKSLDVMLKDNYFGRTRGEVLCYGAGGSTTAIILHLLNKKEPGDRPRRIVVVNRSPGRIEHLRRMIGELTTDIRFEFHCHTDPALNDALMARLAPRSLVINATGMGKDLPGSPITNRGQFPPNGIAWELNYRGELEFLHQALAQQQTRSLMVEDGWLYFLYGWTEVIAEVLKVEIGAAMFNRLAAIAARLCSPALPPRPI
jgi:shikimate 5-dehydrogenase